MAILVTGGSGFIGSNTVSLAISENIEALNLDIKKDSSIRADISEFNWDAFDLSRFDAVIHLAARISVPESFEIPEKYLEVNVEATRRLFSACVKQGVPRVIFASSAAVYGSSTEEKKIVGNEFPPESPYAETKLAGEDLARSFATRKTTFTVFRFFNVFGHGQDADSPYASVIPKFVRLACDSSPITIEGDGLQTRDFIHVSDVARALISASEERPDEIFEIINLGTGKQISIIDFAFLVKKIAKNLGAPAESEIIHKAPREGDVRDSLADLTGLNRFVDPKSFISFEAGIEDLIADEINSQS